MLEGVVTAGNGLIPLIPLTSDDPCCGFTGREQQGCGDDDHGLHHVDDIRLTLTKVRVGSGGKQVQVAFSNGLDSRILTASPAPRGRHPTHAHQGEGSGRGGGGLCRHDRPSNPGVSWQR